MKKRCSDDPWQIAGAVLSILLAVGVIAGCLIWAEPEEQTEVSPNLSTDYAERLFDDTYVHVIDIQLPRVNWDYMVKFAADEQYVLCDLVIDGEKVSNAAIRPKGNSSLSAIQSRADDHFSFKIEFDHYTAGNTWYGLDKLSLNNLGQDVSCMKDYLAYHMMNAAGAAAPLSSFVELRLNGEPFGLYLAVEAVEDSFIWRNYGENSGNLYKPECFSMAGLTGLLSAEAEEDNEADDSALGPGDRVDMLGSAIQPAFQAGFGEDMAAAALQYLGDDPLYYRVILDSAVFSIGQKEQEALIRAIRTLSESPDEAVDLDQLIPYFVVHNFVDNYDGYTGVFDHNYYLREADGKLSLIPWDYNLAFGVFTAESAGSSILGGDGRYQTEKLHGAAMDDKTSMVNYPIDTPTFTVSTEDRPLLAAVLNDPDALEQYHRVFRTFLEDYFDSGEFERTYMKARNNIADLVAQGLTFYSPEAFETAAQAVHDFCLLRAESVRRQLDGTLPATLEGQRTDYAELVDASSLDLASSVTFDGMLMGITSRDVVQLLDAAAGDNPHTMEGVAQTVAEMRGDPEVLMMVIGRVLGSSAFLQKLLYKYLSGPVLLIVSLVVLLLAQKRIKRYRRRKG